MFVDFNKVFADDTHAQIAIPQPFVDYMNKSLPAGVKYIVDKNGTCEITSETGSLSLGGFVFKPTAEQQKVLGEHYTQQDVFSYFYNSQKAVPLSLKKEGHILLNGQEFPIEKLAFNSLIPIKYIYNSFWLYPSKFPEPFLIKIGCDKHEREILISRVPNESVSVMAFESNCEEPLKVKCLFDEKTERVTITLSLDLIKAGTVLDLIQATSIYNAFIEGKGTFFGNSTRLGVNNDTIKKFDEQSIAFWERVLSIEKILGVQFHPPQNDVAIKDIILVEQLYQSLVNRVPTRDNERVDSLSGRWKPASLGWDINDVIGKPIFFRFECISSIDLFGIKKDLPTLVGVVNAVLKEYKENGKEQIVTFADESQEKKRFNSIMFFESEDELLKFVDGNQTEIIEMFQNARKPLEG